MSDDSSDELGVGIALGFAAALALVAVWRRLRGSGDEFQQPPEDLDDETLLLTIQTVFTELEEHMTELYDRVGLAHGLDSDPELDSIATSELGEEVQERIAEFEDSWNTTGDLDLDDIEIDGDMLIEDDIQLDDDTQTEDDTETDDLDDEDLGL